MDTTKAATGLQIAVLIALHIFATSIAAYYLEPAIGWPPEHSKALSNALAFGLALAFFITVPALRGFAIRELSKPIPVGVRVEVAIVSVAKMAIPFAALGTMFLYYSAAPGGGDLFSQLGLIADPDAVARRRNSTIGLVYATVIAVLVGPLVEELAFRGLLYGAWERRWGWIRAMVATSLCFALAHQGRMLLTFLGSIVFVCLLRRTGTLWAPICAHMVFNAFGSWPLLGHVVMVKSRDGIEQPESWMLEFACLAFVVVAVPIYAWMARAKRTPDTP